MRKLILQLISENENYSIAINHSIPVPTNSNQSSRQSPLYSITKSESSIDLLPNNSGIILFCFANNTFQVVGRLLKKIEDQELLDRIYITRGLSSLVIFCNEESIVSRYLDEIGNVIKNHEIWTIKEGQLIKPPKIRVEYREYEPLISTIKLDELSIEYQAIFSDLLSTLGQAHKMASLHACEYVSVIEKCNKSAHEIWANLLYTQNKIQKSEFKLILNDLYPNSKDDLSEIIANIDKIKSNVDQKVIRLHQLKDEAVQLCAVIQNFCRQGLSGTTPILQSNYEAGEDSLLGIGGVFSALVAIYNKLTYSFSYAADVKTIAKVFRKFNSPQLPHPSNLPAWSSALSNYEGISDAIEFCEEKELSPQLVYFSNRLGFRETKYSITTAYRSINLASLPPWNLCTVFHEYIHAHIRALFSQIYPFDSIITKEQLEAAYDKYRRRHLKDRETNNLFEFIQSVIISVISDLVDIRKSDTVSKYLPKDEITQNIRKWHHSLNEIIAHILDYSYFYNFDNKTYIKGIWSSWLKLPFIYSRISEYLLRTICAIASNEKGREDEIFAKSVYTIKKNLESLLGKEYINNELLLKVISKLEETSEIHTQFILIYPFIYLIKNFLISSQVKASISDVGSALQEDDSYSIELNSGEFVDRKIYSPINFLQEYLRTFFNNSNNVPKEKDEIEFLSLWIYLVVSSSLSQE